MTGLSKTPSADAEALAGQIRHLAIVGEVAMQGQPQSPHLHAAIGSLFDVIARLAGEVEECSDKMQTRAAAHLQ